jgi:hypothetical protein
MFSTDTFHQSWVVVIETRKELQFGDASAHFFWEDGQQCHHTIQTGCQKYRWRI